MREDGYVKKDVKKHIIDCISTLEQVHKQIRCEFDKSNFEMIIYLLSVCQESGNVIGTIIEEDDNPTYKDGLIGVIEEYCESAYHIYCEIENNKSQYFIKAIKSFDKKLKELKDKIEKNIIIRKEVVFVPYNASMWDSMESVWEAANKDPNWVSFVVPAPYFDKNINGDFSTMHYEGEQFPKYVPITHYSEYDFAQRKPDMIIFHNPYDSCNSVTSVHPYFYAKNLKDYTDCLVYIPYFIIDEVNVADLKRYQSFILTPGVLYADKIMVQSEKIKELYIDVLAKATGINEKDFWEKKIFGLGSPKFDEVSQQNVSIPIEWNNKMIKKDKTRKKVIFYNTSLSMFLMYSKEYMQNMERVFKIFEEHSEDFVVIWRPHPLLKATIVSMRPQFIQQYENIVTQYKDRSWMIYDDSSNLNRVLNIADVYYGDKSSVVALCRNIGMPIMIQKVV